MWFRRGVLCSGFGIRPGQAHFDPVGEIVNLALGQLELGRHVHLHGMIYREDHQALVGVPRNDSRPVNAATQDTLAGVNLEFALHLACVATVAFVATVRQQRPDTGFKEFQLLRRRFVTHQGDRHKDEADGQAG